MWSVFPDTGLWNVEHGYSKLTDRQVELLEALYAPKVNERLKRLLVLRRLK